MNVGGTCACGLVNEPDLTSLNGSSMSTSVFGLFGDIYWSISKYMPQLVMVKKLKLNGSKKTYKTF